MDLSVIIPSLEPDQRLATVVGALARTEVPAIIIVNDGSGPEFAGCFDSLREFPQVHLLRHAANLGKGAALKTGVNYALRHFPRHIGVITADADGQHDPADILKVAKRLAAEPDSLILGIRSFGKGVPLRSKVGNLVTRFAVRLVTGKNISDTQTGLRGIPSSLLPLLLRISENGYAFELQMLIVSENQRYRVVEEPIRTIYLEQNRSSHFNPLLDSMKIYFVLLRSGAASMVTALIDNLVFIVAFSGTASLLKSQIAGRAAAVLFNYCAARRAVFRISERNRIVLPKYLLLVVVSGAVSFGFIRLLQSGLSLPVLPAKLIAESALFFANFAIQRKLIFIRGRS